MDLEGFFNIIDDEEVKTPEEADYEFDPSVVSGLTQTKTSEARRLCIFDIADKLEENDKYDIGTTYNSDNTPDMSFYFTTNTVGHLTYLLNLFVCNSNTNTFVIKVNTDANFMKNEAKEKARRQNSCLFMPGPLKPKMFTSTQIDESHYITSYTFHHKDLSNIHTLYIPIEIETNVTPTIDKDVLDWIKANHNLNIFNLMENTDFTLVSASGKKYELHKLLLAASSPVLRDRIRNLDENVTSLNVDVGDEEMNLLVEYLYKNTIENLESKNWDYILKLIEVFQIDKINTLIQGPLCEDISVDNAIHLAALSEKYKLHDVQKNVIEFISKNPKVFETDGWNNLKDVVLAKKLFKEICIAS